MTRGDVGRKGFKGFKTTEEKVFTCGIGIETDEMQRDAESRASNYSVTQQQ